MNTPPDYLDSEGWLRPEILATLDAEGTDIHRLCTPLGAPESWVERYGNDLLICSRDQGEGDALLAAFRRHRDEYVDHGFAVARIFLKPLRQRPDNTPFALLDGDAAASRVTTCRELGLRYKIDLGAGYSTGLFMDQRANRQFLRSLKPKRLLNLFSYTCAFSLAAAAEGAETVSVDVAKKALDWGKENFALNQIAGTNKFYADDVRDVLRRQQARGETYDAIVLDPPTFARNKQGKVFRIEDELASLIEAALPLLAADGYLLLSTNCETLPAEALIATALDAGRKSRRPVAPVPALPPQGDIPDGHGAQTAWVRRE
ncbi:23S rRNA (cytosine1962-C5)-methyltransferase [Verrucomicrobium sp. GAS474]|uniref:class I SAM-dependent methyltransferase n=1 Tax=Verrucomicrobium sp. GAS474 TaxID=1882831 RepID=UPI00087D2B59|nr:class I SAM-dependent methyltransferase [Verrucomicrobium sp. GAS474]SDT96676.1 23S rRNA (cytosine1962-C5)-methyltransferase [Verrucomicrobium sp. GAS474]